MYGLTRVISEEKQAPNVFFFFRSTSNLCNFYCTCSLLISQQKYFDLTKGFGCFRKTLNLRLGARLGILRLVIRCALSAFIVNDKKLFGLQSLFLPVVFVLLFSFLSVQKCDHKNLRPPDSNPGPLVFEAGILPLRHEGLWGRKEI